MEFGKFLEKPIAPILRKNFVEARLHTDTLGPFKNRILELQAQLANGKGLPIYVIVDAETKSRTGRYQSIPLDDEEVEEYVYFLEQGLSIARGKQTALKK